MDSRDTPVGTLNDSWNRMCRPGDMLTMTNGTELGFDVTFRFCDAWFEKNSVATVINVAWLSGFGPTFLYSVRVLTCEKHVQEFLMRSSHGWFVITSVNADS
jgi:hypothetical protein